MGNKSKNLKGTELEKVISECNFIPAKSHLLITANMYESKNDLEVVGDDEVMLSEWQYVISAGEYASYEAGDKIYLNLPKMVKSIIDPKDRLSMITTLDIAPFMLGKTELTIIPSGYIFGNEVNVEQGSKEVKA